MGFRLSVDGGGEASAALARLQRKLEARATKVVEDEAAAIVDDARAGVERISGVLQDSITAEVDGLTAEVGPHDDDAYYGVWIEWGRSSAAAQPFMTPAAERSRARFPGRVTTELGEEAEGA